VLILSSHGTTIEDKRQGRKDPRQLGRVGASDVPRLEVPCLPKGQTRPTA